MSGDRRCPACGASVDRVVADFGLLTLSAAE